MYWRTTFVVAHRLSTVRNADQIVVFDDGEIVERGDHYELVEENGLYADLWDIHTGDNDVTQEIELSSPEQG